MGYFIGLIIDGSLVFLMQMSTMMNIFDEIRAYEKLRKPPEI
jgi:hypothetical protein